MKLWNAVRRIFAREPAETEEHRVGREEDVAQEQDQRDSIRQQLGDQLSRLARIEMEVDRRRRPRDAH